MNGLQFEDQLTDHLRRLGCVVTTCPKWDEEELIDQRISRINGSPLRPPFEVQVTLNLKNDGKLEGFLQSIDITRRAVFVYIEFSHRRSKMTAPGELRLLQHLASLRPRIGQVFAAVITGSGSYELFDPWARVNRRYEGDPTRTDGYLAEIGSDFLAILNAKTGQFHGAGRTSVRDRRLIELMTRGKLSRHHKVRFTPGGEGDGIPPAFDIVLAN